MEALQFRSFEATLLRASNENMKAQDGRWINHSQQCWDDGCLAKGSCNK